MDNRFAGLADPSVNGLLVNQTVYFRVFLRVCTQCRVRSHVSVTTLTFGRIVGAQRVLVFRHFRGIYLDTFVRPSLRLLLRALSGGVRIRAVFIHAMGYTRSTFTRQVSPTMSAPRVDNPLTSVIVVRARASMWVLKYRIVARHQGFQFSLEPIGFLIYAVILYKIMYKDYATTTQQAYSKHTPDTPRTLFRYLLYRQVYSIDNLADGTTVLRRFTYNAVNCLFYRLLNHDFNVIL